MDFEWLKSFGFKERDRSAFSTSLLEEKEECWRTTMQLRKAVAVAVCPEVGKPHIFCVYIYPLCLYEFIVVH